MDCTKNCTKRGPPVFANVMTFLFFIFSLGELQYLNLESNSLDHLPKNLLHKNVHKKLLDVRLSYNKLRIVDTNTFSSLKVKLMTCFHEFSKYESTFFFLKTRSDLLTLYVDSFSSWVLFSQKNERG